MSRERRIEIHGVRVLPMVAGVPGDEDLVHHVYKHFLALEWTQEWQRVGAREVPTPNDFRAQAAVAGIDPDDYDPDSRPPEWWSGCRMKLAIDAHRDGYLPRYLEVLRRAGRSAGGAWTSDGRRVRGHRSWTATALGILVGGYFTSGPAVFHVVTAYPQRVLRRPGSRCRSAKALPEFEAFLDSRCPGWRARRVSSADRGDPGSRNDP